MSSQRVWRVAPTLRSPSSVGVRSNNLDEVAWYDNNSGNETHPVGQKQPNGYGLHDMSGNVWEWVWDWYDEDEYQNRVALSGDNMTIASQHEGPKDGVHLSLRGGSYFDSWFLRTTFRFRYVPEIRFMYNGFRLVLPSRTRSAGEPAALSAWGWKCARSSPKSHPLQRGTTRDRSSLRNSSA